MDQVLEAVPLDETQAAQHAMIQQLQQVAATTNVSLVQQLPGPPTLSIPGQDVVALPPIGLPVIKHDVALPALPLGGPTSGSEQVMYQDIGLPPPQPTKSRFRADVTFEGLRQQQKQFAVEREWEKFHTPRNLMLALVGEVGELAAIFQWRGEGYSAPGLPEFTQKEKQEVADEMADVLLYLVRMADICNVDLAQAALDKLQRNAAKYPVELCKGSSAKYYAYSSGRAAKRERSEDREKPMAPLASPGADGMGGLMMGGESLSDEDAQKRKRFTEQQIDQLTLYAETANWSLSTLNIEERDRICTELNITRERLQNFFNNRKPKDLKKPKHSTGRPDQPGSMVASLGGVSVVPNVPGINLGADLSHSALTQAAVDVATQQEHAAMAAAAAVAAAAAAAAGLGHHV